MADKKPRFVWVLFTLPWVFTPVSATDLPIDIGIISQINIERQDVLTARHGVDLFTESAAAINRILAEQVELRHETAMQQLFTMPPATETVDIAARVMIAAEESRLFADPVGFRQADIVADEDAVSPWLLVTFFVLCGSGGLVMARANVKRKERRKHVFDSHDRDP